MMHHVTRSMLHGRCSIFQRTPKVALSFHECVVGWVVDHDDGVGCDKVSVDLKACIRYVRCGPVRQREFPTLFHAIENSSLRRVVVLASFCPNLAHKIGRSIKG